MTDPRHPAPGPGRRALVVADDLTGANDTGVQFAEAGWSSTLRLGPAAGPASTAGSTATAVSTDSRALDDSAAADRTGTALRALTPRPGDVVYVKVDSTLRGSVAGQLSGALSVWREHEPAAFVLLSPAYPAMGRTVEEGLLKVHGRPVTESSAADDPVTPVRDEELSRLLPGATHVPVEESVTRWAAAIGEAARSADVVTVDARTDEDLRRLAEVIALLGPRVLPAGSAGLAGPLASRWLPGPGLGRKENPTTVGRPLVLVSSQHGVARRQVDVAARSAEPVVVATASVVDLLDGPPPPEPAVVASDAPLVLLSPDDRAEPAVSGRLARQLAAWAASYLEAPDADFDALVLIGGDGAEALLAALGAHGVAIHGRLLEGVPLGQVSGGAADGLPVVTKAGGFGDDQTLLTLLRNLRTRTETETTR